MNFIQFVVNPIKILCQENRVWYSVFGMKLISLNIWGGKIYKPLIKFLKEQSETTDIFCFQEVFQSNSSISESSGYKTNILRDIATALKDFQGYFVKTFSGYDMIKLVDFDLHFGIAMFIKKPIYVMSREEIFIHQVVGGMIKRKDYVETSRSLQSIRFNLNNKIFNVYNLHGLWIPDSFGKKDNEDRINQSKRIERFMQKHNGEKIIVGDFNLDPDSKSLRILESNLINLIREYPISTTRSNLYTKQHGFADYTLVSSGVNVIDFQVPNISVSDHLPMILEFN